ncbi:ATP-dependent DNA helicase UvrD2 [Micrococcoides hystricis]|uniref:DNA 3'-5' helicase n=1 Tax=Micrococcoides hystricis TaxID=1572761 RepID=A0ABV6P9P8_9MICC
MSAPEEILAGLDKEQRAAATALHGPVCILAGAGTGKTRAITHRIAYGVATGVYDPHKTLALTFTARAAAEMRSRLNALGAQGVQARTFHAAALRQLRYFWPQVIGGPMPQLIKQKGRFLAEAAQRIKTSTDRAALRDLAAEIEWAKVSMIGPEDYRETGRDAVAGLDTITVARLYQGYEDLKTDQGYIDFEDVLLLMVGILEENPDIAAQFRQQYRTFVVDEYQDVSALQQRLLDLWLGDRDDLCVVGDASQTIYSFTGATSRFLLNFSDRFPDATIVKLVRNYRSTPEIIATANAMLAERTKSNLPPGIDAPWPPPLELISQQDSGAEVEFAEYAHDEDEAHQLAARIKELVSAGTQYQDIAVLYRTNSQSLVLEEVFTELNIPYVLRGAERFFERAEVRQAMRQLAAPAVQAETNVAEQVRMILGAVGFTENPPSQSGASRERWESWQALYNLAQQLGQERGDGFTMHEFVRELHQRAEAQHAPQIQGVTLASLHSAKGLEWDNVFLTGLSEGLVPISFAETQSEIDEERRLFYVGITRARKRLYLSWTLARSASSRSNRKRSRFIDGIVPAGHALARTTEPAPTRGTKRSSRRSSKVATCRTCSRALATAAERKIGRCVDCPATYDEDVFEELRAWRLNRAEADEVPAFVVATDATLIALAETMPTDAHELSKVPGIGAQKIAKYGEEILSVLGN